MEPIEGRFLVGLAVALLALVSCRASVKADASAEVASEKSDADLDAEIQSERASSPSEVRDGGAEQTASTDGPLLGARHDLNVAPDQAAFTCSCLKLGLGQPSDPAFRWKGTPPTIDSESQLVVGLTSEGMTCKQPKGSLGASYWGYRQSGNDVVVFVESAVKGRPLTGGAIIPKPFGPGQVYAAPAFKREPFGRGPKGEARCKLGNPGPARSTPPAVRDDASE